MWTLLRALAGGSSSQSASIRRSVETTSPARRRRTASSARCLPAPTSSGCPRSDTSNGPRTRNSIGSVRLGHAASFSAHLKRGTSGSSRAAQARRPTIRGVVVLAQEVGVSIARWLRWLVVLALLLCVARGVEPCGDPSARSEPRSAVHGRGQRARRRFPLGRCRRGSSRSARHDAARARPRAGLATRSWRRRELMRRSRSAEGGCRSMQRKSMKWKGPLGLGLGAARGGGLDSHDGLRPAGRTGGRAPGHGPVPPRRCGEGSRATSSGT